MAKNIVPSYGDDESLEKPYTRKESAVVEGKVKLCAVSFRHHIMDLFLHRAHVDWGFASFEEYSRERLDIEMTPDRLYKLRRHAKVECDVLNGSGKPLDASMRMRILEDAARAKISENAAMELAKLPPSQRRDAWEEMHTLGAPDHSQLSQLKHVIQRRLNELNGVPLAEPKPPKPYVEPKKKEKEEPEPDTVVQNRTTEEPELLVPETVSKTDKKADEPKKAMVPTPQPTRRQTAREPEPQPNADELPLRQWEEALLTVLTWVQNAQIDGDMPFRTEVSKALLEVSRWTVLG